jgi:uncharacterized membrane protein
MFNVTSFLALYLFNRYAIIFFPDNFYQVTILVAAEGVHKLPAINGSGDLKEALQKLASIPSNKILVRIKVLVLVVTCKFLLLNCA